VKVGFIGTGNMGAPMAANILAGDYQLTVYDVSPSATEELEKAGAKRAESLTGLVLGSEVVIFSLPGPSEVASVFSEVLPLMVSGQILIDMSTNSPELVQGIAEEAARVGVGFLDAPVSGGVRGAKKGILTIMVGGDKVLFESVEGLLSTMGENIFHAGDVGSGNVAKLINNSLAFSIMMANAEAIVLGSKAGVNPTVLWDIVRVSSGSSLTWQGGIKTILQDRLPTAFTVDLACKDIDLATELATEFDMDLEMVSVAQKMLKRFQSSGLGQQDILATIKSLEHANDVVVRGTWDK
jgi:3-hydroxyisobutyrate dehydrogenase-like beta-hydroxyacid dehydrogenase